LWKWQWRSWFWLYTPLLQEVLELVIPGSCSQVLVEMIVMGKYILIEGRYSNIFIKGFALFYKVPICVF
jgi:hypothetical protein